MRSSPKQLYLLYTETTKVLNNHYFKIFCIIFTGGTLKIYGETLKPDVPYKTLLLSTADTVSHVIKEAMEKYDIDTEDTTQFVLVEVGGNVLLGHLALLSPWPTKFEGDILTGLFLQTSSLI